MNFKDMKYIKYAFKKTYISFSLDLMNGIKSVEDDFYGIGKDERKEIWVKVKRPPYDDFKRALLEADDVSEEEIKENYESEYPEEFCFFKLIFIKTRYGGQYLFVDNELNLCYEKEKTPSFIFDLEIIKGVVKYIEDVVQEHVLLIKNGKYEDEVLNQIPYYKKVGTINRAVLWKVLNDEPIYSEFDTFKNIDGFLGIDEERLENTFDRIPVMTSRIFFECCKAGYDEHNYDAENLNPCEAYLRFSDRRDEGLTKLPIDDADAFLKWYEERPRCGHPWEVCRGGNSTHVSLYVAKDEKGFWFIVAGSSESRFLESINFYMAIKRLGYPVEIRHGAMLANRLKGNEVIGIVPHHVITRYCEGMFPEKNVFSFLHIYEEEKQVVPFIEWQREKVPEIDLSLL